MIITLNKYLSTIISLCAFHLIWSQEKKPNIFVILCDDLGYSDVGFNGSKDILTPNLDKLANNGVIFSSGYVAHPFCGPSRAALITGRYPHKIGTPYNLPANSETIGKGVPVSEKFLSKELQDAGYYTGAIGKWHLGATEQFHPNKRGFDEFFGFLGGGHKYFPEEYRKLYRKQKQAGNKVIWEYLQPLEHNGKPIQEEEYLTDAFSREAMQFLDQARKNKKDNFFLYLAYNAPHTPLEAKIEDMEKFKSIKDEERRLFAAMVYAVDRGVGKIVQKLKANGQFENTLIIFLSDNGGKLSKGGTNNPLKGGKGDTFEGGYRVPMFFHWSRVLPKNIIRNYPVSSLDLYPTFASLAQIKICDDKKLDGKNVLADVISGMDPHKDEMIYALRHRLTYNDVGARKGKWKITKMNNKPWQLFNISKDIGETHDLSYKFPKRLKQMVSETEEWSKSHVAPLWFYSEKEADLWEELDMPNYSETFTIEDE